MNREECIQHVYQGDVVDIWLGWLAGRHEEYVLGKSEKEVREQLKKLIRVDFAHSIDGKQIVATSPDHPGFMVEAPTTKHAEEELIYEINLRRGVVDYQWVAWCLLLGMQIDPKERTILEKEIQEWQPSGPTRLSGSTNLTAKPNSLPASESTEPTASS